MIGCPGHLKYIGPFQSETAIMSLYSVPTYDQASFMDTIQPNSYSSTAPYNSGSSNSGNYSRCGGACSSGYYIFTWPSTSTTFNGGVAGLSLATVPVTATSNNGVIDIGVTSGQYTTTTTVGLVGDFGNDRVLSQVEVTGAGSATGLIVTTAWIGVSTSPTIFSYFPVVIGNGAPTAGTVSAFTFTDAPTEPLQDFATTAVENSILLFWAEAGGSSINYTVFDPATGTAGTAQELATVTSDQSICSIDVTTVQTASSQGATSSQIVVVALLTDSTISENNGILLQSYTLDVTNTIGGLAFAAGTSIPMPSLSPPTSLAPSTTPPPTPADTIRIGWGNLPVTDQGTGYQNGLVLSWNISEGDGYFDNCFDTYAYYTWGHGAPTPYANDAYGLGPNCVNVVSLDPATFGNSIGWQDIRNSGYAQPNTDEGTLAVDVSQTVMFPITAVAPNSNDMSYYLGFGQLIFIYEYIPQTGGAIELLWASQFVVQEFLGFNLTPPASSAFTATSTAYNSSQGTWSSGDCAAAVSSWYLIGMIGGLPPYYPSTSTPPSLTYALSEGTGMSVSTSASASLTVSGKAGPVHASLKASITASNTYQGSAQFTIDETWTGGSGDGALPADQGILIYWAPDYNAASMTIDDQWGNATGMSINIVYPTGGGLQMYYVDITNLNAAVDATNPILPNICDFPAQTGESTSILSWQPSTSVGDWTTLPACLASLTPYYGPIGTPVGTQNAASLDIVLSTETTSSLGGEITITIGADLDALDGAFGVGMEGELDLSVTVTTTVTSSTSFTMSYPALPSGQTYSSFSLQASLFTPDGTQQAPWMPALNANQSSWLLAWQVTDTVDGTTGTVGGN